MNDADRNMKGVGEGTGRYPEMLKKRRGLEDEGFWRISEETIYAILLTKGPDKQDP